MSWIWGAAHVLCLLIENLKQISTESATIPAFFSTVKLSAVAKWAADKTKPLSLDIIDVDGRSVEVRTFIFEGKFPRFAEGFTGQWDVPSDGKQYTCRVRNYGGEYRGQKPTVLVSFTEYSAIDGKPLPI